MWWLPMIWPGCTFDVDFSLDVPPPCDETGAEAPPRLEPERDAIPTVAATSLLGTPAPWWSVDLERGSLSVVVARGLVAPVLRIEPEDLDATGAILVTERVTEERIQIVARCPDAPGCPRLLFVAEVPERLQLLEVRTGDGDVLVEDAVTDLVNVQADHGEIVVLGTARRVRATTGTGDVVLDLPLGERVDVRSGGATDVRGVVTTGFCARSEDLLDVVLTQSSALTLVGGDGGVDAQLDTAPRDLQLVAAGGDARLALPGGGYALEASLGSADTLTRHPAIQIDTRSPHRISVLSLDGDVVLEAREGAP